MRTHSPAPLLAPSPPAESLMQLDDVPQAPSPRSGVPLDPSLETGRRSSGALCDQPVAPSSWSRLVWISLLVSLALLGAWLGVGHWRGGVQMRELQRVAALEQAALDARSATRPALWGEGVAESAWPHYEKALTDVEKLDSVLVARVCRMATATLTGQPLREPPNAKPPTQTAPELLAAHTIALAELRAGARAEDSRRPMTWTAGFSHRVHNLLTVRAVANLAKLEAHSAAAAGHDLLAVQRLLDGMQMGRDFMQVPILIDQMIGCATLRIAAREGLAEVDLWRRLGPAALTTLAEGLARLDASLPVVDKSLTGEAVLFANHFARSTAMPAGLFGPGPTDALLALQSWRYGCSLRLAAANHGLAQLAAGQRLQASAAGRASFDLAEVTRIEDELRAAHNPVAQFFGANLTAAVKTRLETIAHVRLLRMACRHAQGAAIDALPDPFGGDLRHELDESGTATFWSAAARKHTEFTMRR